MNCTNCRMPLDEGAAFCVHCGTPLNTAARPSHPAEALPNMPSPAETGIPELNKRATAAMLLGIFSLPAALMPYIGLLVAFTGLVLGLTGLKSGKRRFAIIGIGLSALGMVLAVLSLLLLVDAPTEIPLQGDPGSF